MTFRLFAPHARTVTLVAFGERRAMRRTDAGVWVHTTDPLVPDIYNYTFDVDDVVITDPRNPSRQMAFVTGGESLVRVPGRQPWDPPAAPRGAVTRHVYQSSVIGDEREFHVYTPPGYEAGRSPAYPVLYLLHGLGDDATAWLCVGAADAILDNLIAAGRVVPMVMVLPLGYGTAGMLANGDGDLGGRSMFPNFVRGLVDEVMPQVEARYRVSRDRQDRAIAGLSMGGAQAAYAALTRPDLFGWVASFSGAFVMWPSGDAAAVRRGEKPPVVDAGVFDRDVPDAGDRTRPPFHLFWVGCGDEDFLIEVNRQFTTWLAGHHLPVTRVESPGAGHDWSLWRRNLVDVSQQLFRRR